MAKSWRDKYSNKGVCDFGQNYDFYFKWLLNKVMSCIVIKGGEDHPTINKDYLKMNLILDGGIVITDFNDKLYACIGNLGGEPDEYYVPTCYTISNPVLKSKTVYWKDFKNHEQNGVLICNTSIDKFIQDVQDCGLFKLIHQTATMLADNIVSINCCQINTRVVNFFTADSEEQAEAGEEILKEMYAGVPFKILRSDLVEKLQVSPTARSDIAQNITELVELHNYIIGNFFQSIGIKANNVRKKERLITDEINSQDAFVSLSITEMLESWTRGFDEVNEFYGTDYSVVLNPTIAPTLIQTVIGTPESNYADVSEGVEEVSGSTPESTESDSESTDIAPDDAAEETETEPEDNPEVESESTSEEVESSIEDAQEAVEAIADAMTGDSDEGGDEDATEAEDQ